MQETINAAVGEAIIQQGQPGHAFYILQSGALEVLKNDVRIAEIKQPDTIFGEMAALLGHPRTCTVKAIRPSVIMKVEIGNIAELPAKHPDIAAILLKVMAERLEETNKRLAGASQFNPFFSVPTSSIELLGNLTRFKS